MLDAPNQHSLMHWIVAPISVENVTWKLVLKFRSPGSCVAVLISQQVFVKSFCKSQFPNKSVNLFFILVTIKESLTDLWGSRLLQNEFINTICEISEVTWLWRSHTTLSNVTRRMPRVLRGS